MRTTQFYDNMIATCSLSTSSPASEDSHADLPNPEASNTEASNPDFQEAGAEALHWFALKTYYRASFELETALQQDHLDTFFPCERVLVQCRNGEKKYVRRPLISGFLFFRATLKQALQVQKTYVRQCYLFTRTEGFQKVPCIIPDAEMNRFMLVVSAGDAGLEVIDDHRDFTQGEAVRVIDGPFKGAEGYICRIKKNRRLVVSIQGLCAVATSYIPREFLQPL